MADLELGRITCKLLCQGTATRARDRACLSGLRLPGIEIGLRSPGYGKVRASRAKITQDKDRAMAKDTWAMAKGMARPIITEARNAS